MQKIDSKTTKLSEEGNEIMCTSVCICEKRWTNFPLVYVYDNDQLFREGCRQVVTKHQTFIES